MNIKDGDAVHQSIAAADISVPEGGSGSKRRKGRAKNRVACRRRATGRRFPDPGGEAPACCARTAGDLGLRRSDGPVERAYPQAARRRLGRGRALCCDGGGCSRECGSRLLAAGSLRSPEPAADEGRGGPSAPASPRPTRTSPSCISIARRTVANVETDDGNGARAGRHGGEPPRLAAPAQGPQWRADDRRDVVSGGRAACAPTSCSPACCRA